MVEIALYIALGFLTATLLGLIVMPAVWRRAVRLTKRRIEASVPLTRSEILADRDQMAAEYAVRVRRLEMGIGALRRRVADHMAEVSRRGDAVRAVTAERDEALKTIDDLTMKLSLAGPHVIGPDSPVERLARIEAENLRLAEERDTARADMDALERSTGFVNRERAMLADEREGFDARLAQIEERLAQKTRELAEATARHQAAVAELRQEVDDARSARMEAAARLASGATEMATLRAERETLSLRLAAVQASTQLSRAVSEPVLPVGDNSARAIDDLEAARADLEGRLAEVSAERDRLAADLEVARAAVDARPIPAGAGDGLDPAAVADLRRSLTELGARFVAFHATPDPVVEAAGRSAAQMPAAPDLADLAAEAGTSETTVMRKRRKQARVGVKPEDPANSALVG